MFSENAHYSCILTTTQKTEWNTKGVKTVTHSDTCHHSLSAIQCIEI